MARAGQKRKRVQLLKPSVVGDAQFNQAVRTFTSQATVWAFIKPHLMAARTGEDQGEQQLVLAELQIEIRYFAGVDESWRVKYGTRMFAIKRAINVEERNAEMWLLCNEI